MPKIPLYPSSASPNDDDLLILEDSVTSNTKKIKRSDLLGGNTITATNDIKTDEIIGIADADSGTLYGIAVTNKKLATANSVPQSVLDSTAGNGPLKSKLITFTRDAGAASGDVSYTGVGFIPSSVTIYSNVDNTIYFSVGSADASKTGMCILQTVANQLLNNNANVVSYSNGTSWAQSAYVKSYDADGFTLGWTKVGTPSAGTVKIVAICYR